jgi:anti-sigma regulatory factor (Ser/Thr protein kinase)
MAQDHSLLPSDPAPASAKGGVWTYLWKGWALSFAGFGVVAFCLTMENVTHARLSWMGNLRPSVRDWLPWAIVTPPLFLLVTRFPLEHRRWRQSLPLHLGAFVAVMVMFHLFRSSVLPASGQASGPVAPSHHRKPPWAPDAAPGPGAGERMDEPPPRTGRGARPSFDLLRLLSVEAPLYLLVISGAHTLILNRRAQAQAAGLTRARLDALRMQLQPHFLFNTLNTIAGLVHEEPDKAEATLIALSDLLRLTLETSGELELPLRRELDFVRTYFGIVEARFEERVSAQYEIDPGALDALVPAFILQPLVENAVRHGLEPKREGGRVTIQAERNGAFLELCVGDNGVGLSGASSLREGIGLCNTRERIRELYQQEGSVTLRENGAGLAVVLRFPFRQGS